MTELNETAESVYFAHKLDNVFFPWKKIPHTESKMNLFVFGDITLLGSKKKADRT